MDKWLPVVGYKGLYEVSDTGKVRRIAPWCDGRPIAIRGELTGKITKSGYRRVTLQRDRIGKEFLQLRLSAWRQSLSLGKIGMIVLRMFRVVDLRELAH